MPEPVKTYRIMLDGKLISRRPQTWLGAWDQAVEYKRRGYSKVEIVTTTVKVEHCVVTVSDA